MRRATSVIIGILMGALASALGVGIFLYKANSDRERLAEQLAATTKEAQTAREENQRAVEDANRKLLAANSEVSRAQQLVKYLEEERLLLASAEPLSTQIRAVKGWQDAVALSLGVSVKLPSGNAVESNDMQAFTVVRANAVDSDPRWLSVTPYNARLEQELFSSLATSTAVSYLVNGRLMTGYRGYLPLRKDPVLVLRVRYGGEMTHLVWARSAGGSSLDQLYQVLSTFRFAS